ncbi:MAG: hypothetical protein HUJ76_02035 [Parasporobacterium sp.]|nr:hypothetical protein [Parasporobacterium sp.]
MLNLYEQKPNTVDVLVLGTSTSFAGINTNVLWNDYGIAAYDLCCAEQGFWSSYYYLEEALKLQTPSLILLDAKPSTYYEDYTSDTRTILSTSGIRSPLTRINAINACVGSDRARNFILWMPEVHGNYRSVTWQDFVFPADNEGRGNDWKGFIEYEETEQHQRPSLVWVSTKKPMHAKEEEYVRKIFELASEYDIPVQVVSLPNPDYGYDHMYVNSLAEIAKEYGASFANYNNPDLRFGLRYSSDFSDWQHLNVKGSVTFSKKLGQDLTEQYDIPDRRGQEGYESYDTCAEKWFAAYPEYADSEV